MDTCKDWKGKEFGLLPGEYWHLFDSGGFLANNLRVGKGIIYSASFIAQTEGLNAITTPYAHMNSEQDKEDVWESVRKTHFPDRPSRLRTFYCFPSKELAERANDEWFAGRCRQLVEIKILRGSTVFEADSEWLKALPTDWDVSARGYWSGQMTKAPFPEVIIHGAVYAPDWETLGVS